MRFGFFCRTTALLLVATLWVALAVPAAALDFPPLSGRVVDAAVVLGAAEERRLTEKLARHESETSNQVVVVTLPSLQGTTIEDFGYQLGRHWGIGQEGRDNGVLLIVAPSERKVRIEVGYGLEGDLPDAIAKTIIEQEILPAFRSGDLPGGIAAGADAILAAIAGTYEPLPEKATNDEFVKNVVILGFFLALVGLSYCFGLFDERTWSGPVQGRHRRRGRRSLWTGTGSSGGFGGGGGGFSGGGGGFGGGGSSGSW